MKIANETLDRLGDRFVGEQIGTLLKIDFAQYLANPALYDTMLDHLKQGQGINIHHGVVKPVQLH